MGDVTTILKMVCKEEVGVGKMTYRVRPESQAVEYVEDGICKKYFQ